LVRTCKAVRRIVCCVQCSLPCVDMRGWKIKHTGVVATSLCVSLPETISAKEAKIRICFVVEIT